MNHCDVFIDRIEEFIVPTYLVKQIFIQLDWKSKTTIVFIKRFLIIILY